VKIDLIGDWNQAASSLLDSDEIREDAPSVTVIKVGSKAERSIFPTVLFSHDPFLSPITHSKPVYMRGVEKPLVAVA
jgi:hypothetical protein